MTKNRVIRGVLAGLVLGAVPAGALAGTVESWECANQRGAEVKGLTAKVTRVRSSDALTAQGVEVKLRRPYSGSRTRELPLAVTDDTDSVQELLSQVVLVRGSTDSNDDYHMDEIVVMLVDADRGASAVVVTELDSGRGTVKDSLTCKVTRERRGN